MRFNRGVVSVLASAAILASGMIGCVQKRGDKLSQGIKSEDLQPGPNLTGEMVFAQGQGQGLTKAWKATDPSRGAIKRSEFTLNTGKILKQSKNSIAEKLSIEPEVDYIKQFDIVDYQTNDPYLQNTAELAEMLGEENKTYGIAYELTPNFLVLNKIVKENEISSTEQTYSRQLEDTKEWIVPIGGYAITGFYNLEKQINEDNRPTNILLELPVARQNYLQAQYFKLDVFSFKKFARQEKPDVLAKTFFEGEWYFSETTVEARLDVGTAVGDLGSSDAKFTSATRIIFKLQGTNLVGLNTNVDEEFKKDEFLLNYNTVVKIPIEQIDYRRESIGDNILSESVDSIKKQEETRFVKLDFLKSETPQSIAATLEDNKDDLLNAIYNQINNFKVPIDVTYGKDYLSFSVRDAESGSIKRYSFRKIDPTQMIAPRRAFIEDNRLLGSFTTRKSKKMDFSVSQKEDVDKLILMARHNPNKDIEYYFTDQTPKDDWHRNIGREAIHLWNIAFERAGLTIRLKLNESKDVPLGDIRYNVLNIVKMAGAGLLGFGPSLIDSETGEIVSTSMNVGMDNVLEQYYRLIRDYLGRKSGRYYDFRGDAGDTKLPTIFGLLTSVNSKRVYLDPTTNQYAMVNGEGLTADKTHLDPASFTDQEKVFIKSMGLSPNASVKDFQARVLELRINSHRYADMDTVFNFNSAEQTAAENYSSTKIIDEVIETNCKAVVDLAETMKTTHVATPDEVTIIRPCVELFAQADGLTTVLHEMGHNLSMRHNFAASTDTKNFPDITKFPLKYITVPKELVQAKGSSVMDYLTMEGQQISLGEYDIATIRWIYRGEVETKDGKIVKVDETKPITATVPEENLRPFTYCTDEHRGLDIDPMCDAFDQGDTAKESVRFRIESTYNALAKLYRYDKTGPSPNGVFNTVYDSTLALKEHYDKWRFYLRRQTGLSRGYLQNMSPADYKQVLDKIAKTDPVAFKNQLELRNMIVRFLVDIAFISNKYCVVQDGAEQKLIELEKIRTELLGFGDYSVVSSCTSPAAAKYIDDAGFKYVREFGHFLDFGNFDLDPARILETSDFSGTSSVRAWALFVLTARLSPSIVNLKEGFTPNMLDEPDIREYLEFLLKDRMVNGVRMADENSKMDYAIPSSEPFGAKDQLAITSKPVFKNFASEMNLTTGFASMIVQGLRMPGLPDDGRAMLMFVGENPNRDQVEGKFPLFYDIGSTILYVHDENSVTGTMMAKLQELSSQKSMIKYDPSVLAPLKAIVLKATANLLPTTDPAPMRDILKIYMWLGNALNKLPNDEKNGPLRFLLIQAFSPEIQIFQIFNEQLVTPTGLTIEDVVALDKDPNADPAKKKIATDLLNMSTADIYAQFVSSDPNLKVPTAANFEVRLDSFLTSYAANYVVYKKDADEYDAQRDGILRLLLQLAR